MAFAEVEFQTQETRQRVREVEAEPTPETSPVPISPVPLDPLAASEAHSVAPTQVPHPPSLAPAAQPPLVQSHYPAQGGGQGHPNQNGAEPANPVEMEDLHGFLYVGPESGNGGVVEMV